LRCGRLKGEVRVILPHWYSAVYFHKILLELKRWLKK